MGRIIESATGALLLAGGLTAASGGDARAQTVFCPAAINSTLGPQSGFALQNGACTNGNTGAFSGAALATQALTELSQSTTQESNRSVAAGIEERRAEEQRRPTLRIQPAAPVVRAQPVVRQAPRTARRAAPPPARRVIVRKGEPEIVAAPPVVVQPALPRFAVWSRVYGDYERRSATGATSINCCTGPVAGGIPIALGLDIESNTRTGGFTLGFD